MKKQQVFSEYTFIMCCVFQKASKEPIPEEAELDFKPLEECEEGLEELDVSPRQTKETDREAKREADRKGQ